MVNIAEFIAFALHGEFFQSFKEKNFYLAYNLGLQGDRIFFFLNFIYWRHSLFFSDGVGRSGCVATIMSVIERVKIEQTVDVFQTIKLIRAKRPGAVNTLVSC